MKHPLAAFTAVGVVAALAFRERVDQRIVNLIHGKGFIRDDEELAPAPADKDKKEKKAS